MPDVATPTEVFHALADAVPRLVLGDPSQLDRLVDLYSNETCVVHPFAPFGIEPLRNHADLRRHFAGGPGRTTGAERFEATDRVVHRTEDPEVVVGEFRYTGTAHGRAFAVPCIFVLRVRDGKIVESRDYADHLGFARAFGDVEDFAAALAR
jgi:ketosteroid isomerase-like protein